MAAPLLDLRVAVEVLGGSAAMHREVTEVFLEQLPALLEALSADAAPQRLLPVVHELGSSLGTVGAMRAHRAARALEMRWRCGEHADAARSAAELRALVAASAHALAAALR